MTLKQQRTDLQVIADMITEGSRVLDIGCGNGELLHILAQNKNVDGRGMELSQEGVNACVARGLAVIQGDAEFTLRDYPDRAFDYVVLSQTLQAMSKPADVLEQMLRIGKYAIVS
ncbi:MAG: methyltransferase domain-containing protein, partial [Hyphomicrobiales bacterium]|nr:methyltransferase domain-containing protein [Hyphomicrobiales bacterium]MCY4049729.1 methyltransferase domain-containing protein [Hyphomicrobiales bacterium]MCY4052668.1 methyltransferase domain-containing protein [Hyphomicrobiales bacterium]